MSRNLPARRDATPAIPESVLADPSEVHGYSDRDFRAHIERSFNWFEFGMKRAKLVVGVTLADAYERWGDCADFHAAARRYRQVAEVDRTTIWRWMNEGKDYLARCTLQQPLEAKSEEPISASTAPPTVDSGEGEPVSSTAANGRKDEGANYPPSSPATEDRQQEGSGGPHAPEGARAGSTPASGEVPAQPPAATPQPAGPVPGSAARPAGTSPRSAAGSEGRAGPASAQAGPAPSHAKDAAMRQGDEKPALDYNRLLNELAAVPARAWFNFDEYALLVVLQKATAEIARREALKRSTPASNGSAAEHATFFKKPVKR